MRIRIEKQKELAREPTAEEETKAIQNEIRKLRYRHNDPKKIIAEKDLPKHLAEGWERPKHSSKRKNNHSKNRLKCIHVTKAIKTLSILS